MSVYVRHRSRSARVKILEQAQALIEVVGVAQIINNKTTQETITTKRRNVRSSVGKTEGTGGQDELKN